MIFVFYQYYKPKTAERRAEIDACLKNNIANTKIDRLMLFFEDESHMSEVEDSPRIIKQFLPDRMSYNFWLKETDKLPMGSVSLLLNSDIYLDDSLDYLNKEANNITKGKMFIALTRYNPDGNGLKLNKDPHWTQDVWGVSKGVEPFHKALFQEAAFELGQPGCDNKIAYVMHSYGYTVTNPCHLLRSVHLQADVAREYDAKSSKLIGLHAFVHPSQSVAEASKLEFDLLTRSNEDITDIRFNNWINGRQSYRLKPQSEKTGSENQSLSQPSTDLKKPSTANTSPQSLTSQSALGQNTKSTDENHVESPPKYESSAKFNEKELNILFIYSSRYKILSDKNNYYYVDRFWPVVKIEAIANISKDKRSDKEYLFCRGFLPVNLLDGAFQVANNFRYDTDYMFWQYPCITEKDAFEIHKRLGAVYKENQVIHTYIGIPWATIIDRNSNAKSMMTVIGSRIKSAKEVLKDFKLEVKSHTVCQHIRWKKIFELFKLAEITNLTISHKIKGEDEFEGVQLHPWILYAVNYYDQSRSRGFVRNKISDRKIIASFEGAFMKHYISNIRNDLKILKGKEGYHVVIKDLWHFNKVVYNLQVKSDEKVLEENIDDEVLSYNRLMSDTVFSICPSGAGPNSLRLWEAFANGSIPVLLSDTQELPDLSDLFTDKKFTWDDAMVIHPEANIEKLPDRLQQLSQGQRDQMQAAGQEIFKRVSNLSCFGKLPFQYDRFEKPKISYALSSILKKGEN